MLAPLLTRFLQHVCNQNDWAKPHLKPHAGKVVRFQLGPITNQLEILEDGSLCIAAKTSTPDATVSISPSLALRLIAKDETAKNQIHVNGDHHLASEFGKVLQHMRWDIEDDMAGVVGDIASVKISQIALKTGDELKRQAKNAAEGLNEFLQEEELILAKKRHVETFIQEVDTLASDVARLEKRLEILQKQQRQDFGI